MATYKYKFNPITGKMDLVNDDGLLNFKESVSTYTSLPTTGNSINDGIITDDTGHLYVWSLSASTGDLTDWIDQGDVINVAWGALTGSIANQADLQTALDGKLDDTNDVIKDSHIDWGTGAGQVSAIDIPNTPTGNITATELQGAINELDTEKEPTFTSGDSDQYFRGDKSFQDLDLSAINQETSLKIGNPTHIDTLREQINHIWSAGIVDGGAITDNANGTVNIAECTIAIRASASSNVDIYSAIASAQNNITMVDGAANYLYVDYNSGTPQWVVGSSVNDFNCQDKCLGYVVVREGTNLEILDLREQNVDANSKLRRKELETQKFTHVLGGSVLTSSNLNLLVTSGGFYYELKRTDHSAFDTSASDTFSSYYTSDSGSTWTKVTAQTEIDNTYYNDITSGLVAMTNTAKFKVDWVHMIINNPSKLVVLYGQNEYGSLAEAQAAPYPSTVPPVISALGAVIGKVILQKSDTTMIAESTLDQVTSSSPATTHNGLAEIDGGETAFRGHLTSAEHSELTSWLDDAILGSNGDLNVNNLTIGLGAAGVDYTLTFDGETNDGLITWMEDEDYFQFADDILIPTSEKIYFRDTAISIESLTDGHLDLTADTSIDLNQDTILGIGKYLYDADKDTGICLEETTDSDEIVMKVASVEALRIEDDGQISLPKQSCIAVYRNTSQTIPSTTETTVIFNIEDIDTQSEYNTSTGEWTCKTSGTYVIRVTARFASSSTSQRSYLTFKLDTGGGYTTLMYADDLTINDISDFRTHHGFLTYSFTAGDKFKVDVYHSNASSINIEGARRDTSLSISRIA